MELIETLSNFYDIMMDGDSGQLLSLFVGEPIIDTPMDGRVAGREAFLEFAEKRQAWLKEHKARPELLDITENAERICVEIVLYMEHEKEEIDLPVAMVADLKGKKVSEIRVYHSTWPLTGKHQIRPPVIEPDAGLDEPQFVRRYMEKLKEGDASAIIDLFADSGYAREPSGSNYIHAGREGIREFYTSILQDGGISLKHCTATFDGKQVAIEYIATAWGRTELPPQAGVAVYEVSESGKMIAARIYDDVNPPEIG